MDQATKLYALLTATPRAARATTKTNINLRKFHKISARMN